MITWNHRIITGVLAFVLFCGCSKRADDCELNLTCDGAAGSSGSDGDGGGGGSSGGLGGDGGSSQTPVGCDPVSEECEPAMVIHVSPSGNDEAAGTAEEPVATVARALDLVAESNEAGSVYVCSDGGGYAETLTLGEAHLGIAIVGGYSCEDFSRNDVPAEFEAGAASGHRIAGATGALIADLVLVSPAAAGAGASSMALTVLETEGVRILRTTLESGAGAAGADGEGFVGDATDRAEPGVDGNAGHTACPASADLVFTTGLPVTTTCGGVVTASASGEGGLGAPGAGDASSGTAGAPVSATGGEAGAGQTALASCDPGGNGEAGEEGVHGQGAAGIGALGGGGYVPTVAASGAVGEVGQAGGGGGGARKGGAPECLSGARGGSGGSGGCGGGAGGGGQSGGGSFALVSVRSSVEVDELTLVVAGGGAGGAGGNGQMGGVPGNSGGGGSSGGGGAMACQGGVGGTGGSGGSGGGGSGGPSIGIAYVGEPVVTREVNVMLPEDGAAGGSGGLYNTSGAGSAGLVTAEREF